MAGEEEGGVGVGVGWRRQIKVHSSTNASTSDQMTAHVAAAAVVSMFLPSPLFFSNPHVLPCSQLWHAPHRKQEICKVHEY